MQEFYRGKARLMRYGVVQPGVAASAELSVLPEDQREGSGCEPGDRAGCWVWM